MFSTVTLPERVKLEPAGIDGDGLVVGATVLEVKVDDVVALVPVDVNSVVVVLDVVVEAVVEGVVVAVVVEAVVVLDVVVEAVVEGASVENSSDTLVASPKHSPAMLPSSVHDDPSAAP